jgi:hypothetical protein
VIVFDASPIVSAALKIGLPRSELALAAGAEIIVSSNDDPRVLHPCRGVPILGPGDYLVGGCAGSVDAQGRVSLDPAHVSKWGMP